MDAPMHCGLDFGTSNSTLGTVTAGSPALMALEDGRPTIPSAIFFDFETDAVHFGRRAQAEYVSGTNGRLMRSLKSILGTQLIEENTRIKKNVLPYLDILGIFIAELKRRAEASHGALDHVVVGRPVQFVDDDAEADAKAQGQLEGAVRAQGFRHIEFQYEPIAAALDYEQQVTAEELGMVIDLGGGTSDFSVVRVSPERRRTTERHGDILATTGVHIGGTDFDRLLSLAKVMPELGYRTETAGSKRRPLPSGPYYDLASWHRINRLYTPQTLAELRSTMREALLPERVAKMISIISNREGHRLASSVEAAKIALTDAELTSLGFSGGEVSFALPTSRAELAAALDHAIGRIGETIGQTLQLAGLRAAEIQTLILTGGSTQIPAIMAQLKALFPDARFVATDAFGSVGLGLALDAQRKFG
ncbi:MAG TPA: Hsp70 family protein [Devosiaceae bacterium]|nr:Hsp70 family protein [Devosiaceae bacterium]